MTTRFLCAWKFLVPLIFYFSALQAQNLHKPLRFLTTKDELPQSFVSGIVQDKAGFVWIATRNGLARYDGLHFKQFRHNARDTATIHSNVISRMVPDKQNRIWINYESGGLDCFNPVTETVVHVTDEPLFRNYPIDQFWLPAVDGNLWSRGFRNGIRLYDRKHNRFFHFSAATGQLPDDSVSGFVEDRRQQVWIASQWGLTRYDPQTGRFQKFLFPDSLRSLDPFFNLHQRTNGELMMSNREMLLFFNPVYQTFRTIPLPQYYQNGSWFLQSGPDGTDYFECAGTIYRYSDTNQLQALFRIRDFSDNQLQAFLVDRAGLFWLGLNTGGICQVDVGAPSFEVHPNTHAFQHDLLKQEFGLQLDQFSGWPLVDPSFNGLGYFFRSAYDAHHRLWIGLRNKVGYYDSLSHQWITLPPIPGITGGLPESGLRGIDFGPDGRLWAVSETHFAGYFDAVKKEWIYYVNPFKVANLPKGVSIFTDIKVDAKELWITGRYGLLCMDIATRHVEVFNQQTRPGMLPTDGLLGMERDPTRPYLLWIGSHEGLICLNKQTLKAEVFTTQHGLPDNTIYSIQADGQGYLWLSTNQGLCRFHPVTHTVRNFKTEDGLPGNEFNRFHHLKLPDGRLGFGGLDGWVLFDPTTIKPDAYQPQVAFTGLKIYNEPVLPGNKLMPRPLNDLKELVLPYDQNTLTFEFAGLEYSQPGKLHYRYRLEGYDDKWVTTDNPTAGYTRLGPGHYTLQINCTNTTGQWSRHVRTLKITVLPPWWRTGWAYTFYILSIAGIGYALHRAWLQRQKSKQQIILQQKEAEQLRAVDEMKSRFFSNITHEFRTPLSLIMAPAEQMQKEEPSHQWKEGAGTIQRNAGQMLRLINQLLDMAKLEADSMKVSLFRGNVESFLKELTHPFIVATAVKGIELQVYANTSGEEYLFDADKLHTILSNLLSNAVKFTPAGGSIRVVASQQSTAGSETIFLIQVKDNGIGIAAEKLPFIFNRFYQADDSSTRSYGGTGIGLALAKELAELMQGTLTVSSELGSGTVFTLTLPLAKATDTAVPAYKPANLLPEALAPQNVPLENLPEMDTAGKPLILIVEDNEELNGFIAQTFQQQYRVLMAANGIDGLKIANEELPDVIISDWMMPGMDGPSFCQAVKTNIVTNHIAFILLTAKAAPVSRIEGLKSRADDYITKPFIIEELQLRVANLLEQQRRLREKLHRELSHPGDLEVQPISNAAPTPEDQFLKEIHAIIEDRLDDTSLGVEDLTVCLGMSRSNLQRKLKAVAGITPGTVIRNYRLQRATHFLKSGYNSSETAYKTGFETPAYFTKCFGDFYELTPTEFVRQHA